MYIIELVAPQSEMSIYTILQYNEKKKKWENENEQNVQVDLFNLLFV